MALRYGHPTKPDVSAKFRRASPLDNYAGGALVAIAVQLIAEMRLDLGSVAWSERCGQPQKKPDPRARQDSPSRPERTGLRKSPWRTQPLLLKTRIRKARVHKIRLIRPQGSTHCSAPEIALALRFANDPGPRGSIALAWCSTVRLRRGFRHSSSPHGAPLGPMKTPGVWGRFLLGDLSRRWMRWIALGRNSRGRRNPR